MSVPYDRIQPLTTKKEDKMEDLITTDIVQANEIIKQQRDLINAHNAKHQNCDYWKSENGRIGSQLIELVNNSCEDEFVDAGDIIRAICEIIDYEPKKEISFTATFTVTGRMEVAFGEDYDLTDIMSEAYMDINNGDVVIDTCDVYDVQED